MATRLSGHPCEAGGTPGPVPQANGASGGDDRRGFEAVGPRVAVLGTYPETRVEQLVGLRMVAAVRPGHPLTEGPLTPARLAAAEHVVVSRRGRFTGPSTPRRPSSASAGGWASSSRAAWPRWPSRPAATSSAWCPPALPGAAPSPLTPDAVALGLHLLDLPLSLPPVTIGMAWHPRHTADGGHRWLRDAVRRVLRPPAAAPGAAVVDGADAGWAAEERPGGAGPAAGGGTGRGSGQTQVSRGAAQSAWS